MAAFGGRLPMNLVVAVARNIFAELFKIASFSDLSLRVNPEGAAVQKQRGQIFSFAEQIGIDANLTIERPGRAKAPKPERRFSFEVRATHSVVSPGTSGEAPIELRPFGR